MKRRKRKQKHHEDLEDFRKKKGLQPQAPTAATETPPMAAPPTPTADTPAPAAHAARAAHVEHKEHITDEVNFEKPKSLLPDIPGCRLYEATDGRFRIVMPGLSPHCPKRKTCSAAWQARTDDESFRSVLVNAWDYIQMTTGTQCPHGFNAEFDTEPSS